MLDSITMRDAVRSRPVRSDAAVAISSPEPAPRPDTIKRAGAEADDADRGQVDHESGDEMARCVDRFEDGHGCLHRPAP